MTKRRKFSEEPKKVAPAYILTFSDMVTLLLTFFVMLLSMAENQVDDALFYQGQSSFKKAVADFGISGFLHSKHSGPQFDNPKPLYHVDEGEEELENRVIDSRREMLRRIIMDIEQKMNILPSQISGKDKLFTATNIKFDTGQWELNESAKQFLISYASQIQPALINEISNIYIVGMSNDGETEKQNWIVSTKRAQATADFLKEILPQNFNCSVYSWGAGTGGDWTGSKGIISDESHIMIALISGVK